MEAKRLCQSKALTRICQIALRLCYGTLTEELMRLKIVNTYGGIFGHGSLWKIEQKINFDKWKRQLKN